MFAGRSLYGFPEHVDKVATNLGMHTIEHRLETFGSMQVDVADHWFRAGSYRELDAPTVLRIRGAAHQTDAGQPFDHRAGGWQTGAEVLR